MYFVEEGGGGGAYKRRLCTRESISRLAPSCGEYMHFFCFNYRQITYKEELPGKKLSLPFIFWK